MKKGRVLSGMQPTGKIHLGNYLGALKNWADLQDDYQCFYMVADLHSLTSEYEDTSNILNNIYEMVIDWLCCGISPEKSVLFVQSEVPQHSQLHLILSMITPLSWLERVPTYKAKMAEINAKDLSTYGFLGYPVLQAADILLYQANVVPVGEDQLPHLELTREIARRFNYLYGNTFVEPEGKLTTTPKIVGIDGRKMSKSYENCIYISDSDDEIAKKVNKMITDPEKIRLKDVGHPEVCTVFSFHQIYSKDILHKIENSCRSGETGCVKCKKELSERIISSLTDIRENRKKYISDKKIIENFLKEGREKATEIASKTLSQVLKAINLIK